MAANRGGLQRTDLESLVATGASTRGIASVLGVSQSTVRHWLRRYELTTERADRRKDMADERMGLCATHGKSLFRRRKNGHWRCLKCRSRYVSDRRRRVKAILIAESGGRCVLCGYDRSVAALQFHHVDPDSKRFELSSRGVAQALEKVREEAAKCVLLCANCHAEVETGIATLPAAVRGSSMAERTAVNR